ncbi:HAD family hydrolase [candidate division KSB1 bacterium]|nr:HAD family hydrolase [candidate division KSB1 bacterium]
MNKLTNVTAVLFDVGQTILAPDYVFMKSMLADFGVATDYDALAKGAALGREKFLRGDQGELWKEFFIYWLQYVGAHEPDIPVMLQRIYEQHHRVHLWNFLEPTARDTFAWLRAHDYRMAIVSNADGKVARMLKHLELDHFFECIIDSKIVGVEKPDPAIFNLALQEIKLSAQDCIYVGDNYDRDVVGARRAGLTPVLIDPFDVVPEREVLRIKALADLTKMLFPSSQPSRST